MKNSEKRAALSFAIECLRGQLATLPSDDDRSTNGDPSTSEQTQFWGRPMFARRGGTCAVCRQPFAENDPIIYSGQVKQAAHAACGRDDQGMRR